MTNIAIPFAGRESELAELKSLINKKMASLVVIKGRRRVGKSRLVERFAENDYFYKIIDFSLLFGDDENG